MPPAQAPRGTLTTSWVVAGIERVTRLSLNQSAVYNERKYQRLRQVVVTNFLLYCNYQVVPNS